MRNTIAQFPHAGARGRPGGRVRLLARLAGVGLACGLLACCVQPAPISGEYVTFVQDVMAAAAVAKQDGNGTYDAASATRAVTARRGAAAPATN